MSFILSEDESFSEQKYQQLMNEYTKVKEHNKELPSLEVLNAQINFIEQQEGRQESGDVAEVIDQLKTRIQEQEQLLNERKANNSDQVADLCAKIMDKEQELNSMRAKQQQDHQQQLEELANKINRAQQVLQQEERSLQLLADQAIPPSFALENGSCRESSHSVEENRNHVNSLQTKLSDLRKQEQQIQQRRSNHTNCVKVEEQDDIQNKIKGEREEIERLQQQLQKVKQEYENAEKATAAASEAERKRKAQLEGLKEREHKMKTNIAQVKNSIQRLYEEKKKRQSKPVFNPKIEILKLEKQNEVLGKEKERQIKKLKEYANVSKTYVKYDELVKLNEELDYYRTLNKPLEADIAAYQKLDETHRHLSKSISGLKQTEDLIIADKEANLAKAQEKVKEIAESKAFYNKSIAFCSSKLAEYMKEFPNHEKQKQERKQKQRELKAEEKRKKNEEIKSMESKHKKKYQKNKNEEEQDLLNLNLLNSETDAPPKQSPISGSLQIAIGIGLLVVLVTFVGYNM